MSASQRRKNLRALRQLSDAGSPIAQGMLERMPADGAAAKLSHYRRFFLNVVSAEALTRIRWTGLPATIDPRYLELILFTQGSATITHVDGDALAQMAMPSDSFDQQQNYTEWSAIGAMGSYVPGRTPINSVMIWDNDVRSITIGVVSSLIDDMAQALVTAGSNLIQQRNLVVITATKNNQNDAKRIARMMGVGDAGTVAIDSLASNIQFEVLAPNIQDHTQTAFKARTEYMNLIHAYLGTDFIPHEKESGIESHEAAVAQDAINRQRELFLSPRRRACEQMNELFGWNTSVAWNDIDRENNEEVTSTNDDDAAER